MRLPSLPLQPTLFRWIGPAPAPKRALLKATASVGTNHSKMTVRTIDIGLYMTKSDLAQNIQAADTPQKHQYHPRSHHTLCPTHCSCRSPLCLHSQCYLLPVAADQVCMGLHETGRYIMQNFQAVKHSNTWFSETSSCIFVNTVG